MGELERKLSSAGINQAAKAIAAASDSGVTPGHVRELIAFWEANRAGWSQPVLELYGRVCRAAPGLSADKGWGDWRPGYRRRIELSEAARDGVPSWTATRRCDQSQRVSTSWSQRNGENCSSELQRSRRQICRVGGSICWRRDCIATRLQRGT